MLLETNLEGLQISQMQKLYDDDCAMPEAICVTFPHS